MKLSEMYKHRIKVLVVDDHELIRDIVRQTLSMIGIKNIFDAASGNAALEIMKNNPCDIILTDMDMENGNGLELLKAVRIGANGIDPKTPVMLMTGKGYRELLGVALALDINAIVVKPLMPEVFKKNLKRMVEFPKTIKPPEVYNAVTIPSVEEAIKKSMGESGNSNSNSDNTVAVENLKEGAILKDDVKIGDGDVILKKGTKLTKAQIHDLIDLKEVAGISHVYAS